MTIGELIVLYEQNHTLNLKDWKGISRRLQRYIAPFAALALGDLTKMAVIQWHQEIGRTRGYNAANSALQSLHAMYVKAEEWELYAGKNPANRVKKFSKYSQERFIQSHEMPYLLKSLAEELPQQETFFLMLLLTGCRVGEAQAAKWADLDLAQGLWHKPTTKNGHPHTIPLAAVLIDRLRQLPRSTAWVFASRPNGQNNFTPGQWSHSAINFVWHRVRRRAGLPHMRVHDLRRTTASWLAISGENLPVIQQVLNHSSLAVTQVYARLSVAPVRRALNDQCERMLRPVPVSTTPPPQQTMVRAPSRMEEREEWPG
jgi:integrase